MIIMKLSKEVVHHEITIKLRLLDELRTNTDSILFIDLLKRMIEKIPDQRETCAKLIDHAIFMNIENRCEIVRTISNKCFKKDKCINQNLIKIMDQHNLHKEGSLRASWWDFLDEAAKCTSQQPNIEVCSSFVSLFQHIVIVNSRILSNLNTDRIFIFRN